MLAATSVLGDLIDKCPPAEACRDAFERMSKATVKMCVSTTGFGSQVRSAIQKQDEDSPVLQQHKFDQRIPAPSNFSTMGSRPPPQFDYDLKTLFTDDAPNGQTFHRSSQSWQTPLPSIAPNQAPTYAYAPSNASTPSPLSTLSTTTSNTKQNQMATPEQKFDSSLLSSSFQTSDDISSGPAAYDNYDFDFLMNNDTTDTAAVFSSDVGANLGFVGQHDWADGGGQLPNLFGGFFFGPQGGGEGEVDGVGGFAAAGSGGFDEGIWTGTD